jgi:Spy/CpxP family protein refolding chaperone
MKKRTWILTAILVVATIAAVPFVYGGPGRGHGVFGGHPAFGHGMGILGHMGEIREELDLSDAQVDQIKAIFRDAFEQNAANRQRLHGGMESIARTLIANPNDIAAAQALIDQQAEAERVLKTNILASMSKALNVLTPDQRTKLGTLLDERTSLREERMTRRRSRDR